MVKAPFEFVVTPTTPVRVATPPVESAEVKVVVYIVHPEHSDAAGTRITDVVVVNAPFEFVVIPTTAVRVALPPVESADVKVVV